MSDPHPLRLRAEEAIRDYRADHSPAHLDLLRQDGLPDIAKALTMERVLPPGPGRDRYTAEIEEWLAGR